VSIWVFWFFLLSLVKCPYVPGMYPPVLSLKMREPSNSSHELYMTFPVRGKYEYLNPHQKVWYMHAMHVQSRAKLPWPVLLIKYIISLRWGVKLWYAPLFVPNWVWSSFDPAFPFSFMSASNCCYTYFHCSYMYNYYNYLEPCAFNADSQHFIPNWYKTSLLYKTSFLCGPHSKRG
jgi:hypothetical protein